MTKPLYILLLAVSIGCGEQNEEIKELDEKIDDIEKLSDKIDSLKKDIDNKLKALDTVELKKNE